jgi:hypothetical protein
VELLAHRSEPGPTVPRRPAAVCGLRAPSAHVQWIIDGGYSNSYESGETRGSHGVLCGFRGTQRLGPLRPRRLFCMMDTRALYTAFVQPERTTLQHREWLHMQAHQTWSPRSVLGSCARVSSRPFPLVRLWWNPRIEQACGTVHTIPGHSNNITIKRGHHGHAHNFTQRISAVTVG